jgi:signal transduction histidine kinase
MSPAMSVQPRRISPGLIDVVVALIVAAISLGSAIDYGVGHDRPLVIAIAVVMVAPLLVRQRRPVEALAVILAAGLALPGSVPFELPAAIVVFTIAAGRGWPPAAVGTAAVVLARVGERLLWGHTPGFEDVFSPAIECGAAVAYGLYIGARRATMDALLERAERLERERELLSERAVGQERVRIAQELHDVVAHTVSLIVVQAQALGATAGSEEVARATDGIADLGRQAMAEMHRTLQLLRAGDGEAAERAPQPGLAGLEPLLAQSRAAGVAVTLSVEGDPRPLSQTLDLSAYRIVQEALTNVLKHAGAAVAHVTVVYGPEALALTISDSGGGEPARANEHPDGHGLVGIRERVALFGGTISAHPREGRGFEVSAVLPYPRP